MLGTDWVDKIHGIIKSLLCSTNTNLKDKIMMKKILFVMSLSVVTVLLNGCAAGSATAGYAATASTADGLSSEGMESVLDRTKTQTDAYTDSKVFKLKSELSNRLFELELRVKELESDTKK